MRGETLSLLAASTWENLLRFRHARSCSGSDSLLAMFGIVLDTMFVIVIHTLVRQSIQRLFVIVIHIRQ